MNREILFRGEKADTGEWVYGYFERMNGYSYIVNENMRRVREAVSTETVGQFTGLTDKNGRKIFDGDICVFKNVFSKKPHIGFVRYYAGAKPISDNDRHVVDLAECNPEDLEIIGNIHDNPELLETEEENETD